MVRSAVAPAFKLEHSMFILDGSLVEALDTKDAKKITSAFVEELLETVQMERLGPLKIYLAADQRAPGWSFIQPITTSHISGHYFDKPGLHPHLHFDIYSCCPFNWKKVVTVIHKFFPLLDWTGNIFSRDHLNLDGKNVKITGFGSYYKSVDKLILRARSI